VLNDNLQRNKYFLKQDKNNKYCNGYPKFGEAIQTSYHIQATHNI